VELRRALLLFAVVLGLAAVVTSFSRPAERTDDQTSTPAPPPPTQGTPTARPRRVGPAAKVVSFSALSKPRTARLEADRAAVVTVEVAEAAQVELAGLGLTSPGEPLTPARFEVLITEPGRYDVWQTPAGSDEARRVGVLEVVGN
jgi:hypothetical protein